MKDDAELLRRYVEDRADEAFTELVHRHLGLVYATALRRVGGDTHLAEDVAQKVFTDLARKAPALRGHATLGGWLYVSANFTSAAVVRSEQRRKARETQAQTMQAALNPSTPETDWNRLRPILDDAVVELREAEREAIVLRFFEQRSFVEIGAALRLTEEAARKRVDRALDKLHTTLSKRGVTSTTVALGLALTEAATASTPAGLTAKIAGSSAHASAGAGPGAVAALFGLLKSPVALTGVAAVLGVAALVRQHLANENQRAELAQLSTRNLAMPALRADNVRLTRTLAADEELRRAQAELATLRTTAIPSRAPVVAATSAATVTLMPNNTIRWDSKPVSLNQVLALLQEFRSRHLADHATLTVRSQDDSNVKSLTYIFDEVRKANITKILIESVASTGVKNSWF